MACDFLFLDSGTGGLPYLAHLKKNSPNASCVYVADTKNFPYGTKSKEEIIKCAVAVADFAIKKFSPKALVVACNTISVNALDELRAENPDVSMVGTVPAIKLAAEITKNKKIGLLATKSTVESEYIKELQKKYAHDCEIFLREDMELISFIEKKSFTATSSECEAACIPQSEFFKEKGCDVVILGCTHFLNLSETIQKVLGEKIKVVDSRDGVVRRALSVHNNIENKSPSKTLLYVTGNANDEEYIAVEKKYDLTIINF